DYLNGGDGHDTLVGGEGADLLEGGAGRDVFRFDASPWSGVDRIVDFKVGEDKIELETHVFRAFPDVVIYETDAGLTYVNSALSTNAFTIGAAATTSAQRIVYNSATGALYYDADGSGAVAQVQFAQLSAGLTLIAASFSLYTI
ncbi:M10 family metallopeptidase C-terminal domain-containing protein, partial [Microvirga flavescens]|uniref:M10 family metallopeptidase C-terminal domain-containing protein n=1 Tax=Microvirga flavescens TaxID=2249811 RepID=UPI0018E0B178